VIAILGGVFVVAPVCVAIRSSKGSRSNEGKDSCNLVKLHDEGLGLEVRSEVGVTSETRV
jgi:hypothetical protein